MESQELQTKHKGSLGTGCIASLLPELIEETLAPFSETGDIVRWSNFVLVSITPDPVKKPKRPDKKIVSISRYRLFIFGKGAFGSYSVRFIWNSHTGRIQLSRIIATIRFPVVIISK